MHPCTVLGFDLARQLRWERLAEGRYRCRGADGRQVTLVAEGAFWTWELEHGGQPVFSVATTDAAEAVSDAERALGAALATRDAELRAAFEERWADVIAAFRACVAAAEPAG